MLWALRRGAQNGRSTWFAADGSCVFVVWFHLRPCMAIIYGECGGHQPAHSGSESTLGRRGVGAAVKSLQPWVCCAFLLSLSASAAAQSDAPSDAVPYVDPAATRAMYEEHARVHAAVLTRAYGLSPDAAAKLEQEFLSLVPEQCKVDPSIRAAAIAVRTAFDDEFKRHPDGWFPNDEERERLTAPLSQAFKSGPLEFENLQKRLEARLTPEQIKAGRERLVQADAEVGEENLERQQGQQMAIGAHQGQVAESMEAHRRADATLTPAGKPMPKADYVPPPPPIVVTPSGKPVTVPTARPPDPPRRAGAPAPSRPDQPAAKPAPKPPVAPPIDEWDKQVDSVASKFKFAATQRTRAQAILKDLRQRATQYRKSRGADFERIKRMTDAKARAEEERALSEPLDELFAELKERLDQLPTQEQRDAAGTTTPARH